MNHSGRAFRVAFIVVAVAAACGLVSVGTLELRRAGPARDREQASRVAERIFLHLSRLRAELADHLAAERGARVSGLGGDETLISASRSLALSALSELGRLQSNDPARLPLDGVTNIILSHFALDDSSKTGRKAGALRDPQALLMASEVYALDGSLERFLNTEQEAIDRLMQAVDADRRLANTHFRTALGLSALLGASLAGLVWLHLKARRTAEAELAFKRAKLEMIFDNAPLAIVSTRTDGVCVRWNTGAERLFGWRADEVLGQVIPVVPVGELSVSKELWDRAEAGETIVDLEVQRQRRNGSRVDVALSVAAIRAPGHATELVFIYLDLTARKRSEAALIRAREAAERATQMKSAFLATMSHEIRTPMNGVLGMAGLLLEEEQPAEHRTMVEAIVGSGEHLLGVINDILDVSKIESGRLELAPAPFRPAQLARGVVALMRVQAEKRGVRLELTVDPALPPAQVGDEGRVRQVLTNLVGNALKFTEQGSVTVTLSVPAHEAGLRIAVKDTGVGIPADRLSAIFERFTQADARTATRYGGTGLGLAISHDLVELMGGVIGVESTVGVGSTFWCELPLPSATLPDTEPEAPHAATEPHTAVRLKVLVADDTAINLRVAQAMLLKLGCTVVTAANGAEAVTRVGDERFDLVFMDCHMPVMDGFAATAAIRALPEARGALPIIALTASATLDDQKRCLEAGMDGVLLKPMTLDQLRQTLLNHQLQAR